MEQSNIALLVMGYLKEECLDASAIFAATYSHLLEYRIQTFRNENPSTNVFNTTLNNILQEYRAIFTYIKIKFQEIKGLQSECNSKDLIKHLEIIINTVSGTDPDQNDITTLYDSRTSNVETVKNKNTEDEKSSQARLVLGYLQAECPDAGACFAATSSHLSKYRLEIFAKKHSSTTLNSMTLVDILQQYCAIFPYVQKKLKELGSQIVCISGEFVKNLETIIYMIRMKSDKNRRRCKTLKGINEKAGTNLKLAERQESRLNEVFRVNKYVRGAQREELAEELGLSEKQVSRWFQKKRNDEKDRLKMRDTLRQTFADSTLTTSNPTSGPSMYRTVNENEINICSSSSSIQVEERIKLENILQK